MIRRLLSARRVRGDIGFLSRIWFSNHRSGDESITQAATDGARTYNAVAKILHWSIALLVALQLGIGWTMPEIHKGTRPDGEIGWHLRVGVLIVLLVAA